MKIRARSYGRFRVAGLRLLVAFCVLLVVVSLAADLPTTDWMVFYELSAIGFIVVACVPIVASVAAGGSFFDTPIFFATVCYAAFLGIGPLLAIYFPSQLPSDALSLIVPRAVGVSWLGLIAMFLGYWATRPERELRAAPRSDGTQLDVKTLEAVAWIYLALGVLGLAIYLPSVGGIGFLLSSNYRYRGISPHLTEGLTYEAIRPALLILVFGAVCRDRFRGLRLLFLISLVAFAVLWFGPLRGSRNQILTLIAALWFVITRVEKNEAHRNRMIAGLISTFAVLLVLVWGAERADRSLSDLDVESAPVTATASAAMYAPFKTLNDIVTFVPSRTPYLYGSSILESITVWIPRAFWPDKPVGIGTDAQGLFEGTVGSNSVPTWVGELYWNFGVPGVVTGLLLMGAVCGWWTRLNRTRCSSHLEDQVKRFVYGVSFPMLLTWIWEGSDQAMWYTLENIVPVYLAIGFARRVWLFQHREGRPIFYRPAGHGYEDRSGKYLSPERGEKRAS